MNNIRENKLCWSVAFVVAMCFVMGTVAAGDGEFEISETRWDKEKELLEAKGRGVHGMEVVLTRKGSSTPLGTDIVNGEEWKIVVVNPMPVPCNVIATHEDGRIHEKAVKKAPEDCTDGGDVNSPPTANANGPYSGTVNVAVSFSSAGSTDPEGADLLYEWDFGDGSSSTEADPSHTYISADTYDVSLTVTDVAGDTGTDSTTVTITDEPVACTSPISEHCDMTSYSGPEVCVACHMNESLDMHGSVHYQQGGAFPHVFNIPMDFASAGKQPAKAASDLVATGVNTYCGTVENSPRFTCAGCHVGNGRFPMAESEFISLAPGSDEALDQLANIDCLTCHQEVYKRFPDWTETGLGFSDLILLNVTEDTAGNLIRSDGSQVVRSGFSGIPNVHPISMDFQFLPAGNDTLPIDVPMAPMSLTTLAAAQNAHRTTRQSCLNCHATSGGADGTKRGDMAKENANPSIALDVHMSPSGENLTCANCHETIGDGGESHRMRGRGLDLRPSDVEQLFTCENSGCHSAQPHGDSSNIIGSSKDKHATKVACQACHIPTYAKASVGTESARDWQDPHPTATACNGRGGWLPREDKVGLGTEQVIPVYTWYNGTSEVYYLGESLDSVPTIPLAAEIAASFGSNFNAGDPAVVLGVPNGDITTSSAKIFPMKAHWGKLARNDGNNTLIGHSTFEFFRTGSFCRAVAAGLGFNEADALAECVLSDSSGGLPGSLEMPAGTTAVPVFTYQTINHGVEVSDNALGSSTTGCGSCHSTLTGGLLRMDMETLGYVPRTLPSAVTDTLVTNLNGDLDQICSQCHSNKTNASDREFAEVHERHVEKKGRDCAACHNFSRPERGLSLTRKD